MGKIRVFGLALTILFFAVRLQIAYGLGGYRSSGGVLKRSWEAIALPGSDDESVRVERFIHHHRSLLGVPDNPDIEIVLQKTVSTNIGRRYVFEQRAYGLPVFEAPLILIVSGDRVRTVFNELSTYPFSRQTPVVSSGEALNIAISSLDSKRLRADPEAALGYTSSGKLIYRLRLPGLNPPADWEIWVDAVSGAILRQVDRRIFADGSGRIFDPDPKTALEDNSLTDQGDSNAAIPEEAYTNVTLLDLNDPPVGGLYYLDGPFVSTSETSNRAAEPSPEFLYWREDDRFEEVMVYYHIDREQRYFQDELQTFNANNRQQICNVNGTPEDQSWYSPFSRIITYGYGGVDDGEDADVILHEYGHAVQDDINPFWSGGHTGAMGEGFGDYLAGSYSLTVNPNFQPDWVFNWDGHNEFWAGRILNAPYHYPENAGGEVHDSGQLWSAGLMDVWWDIPDRVAWDRIVLQHHFLIGDGALMEDAAEAILVTELELYAGLFREIIVENFAERGFVDPVNYYPTIVHEPLGDTEDTLQTEFEVFAEITSNLPLEASSLQLFWQADEDPFTAVALSPTGNPDEYSGIIPGPFNEQLISYYLCAADTLGMTSFLPEGAPTENFQFYVGRDVVPPQVVWTDSLGETIFITASFQVQAAVSDNIGIGSAELHWKIGLSDWQSVQMNAVSADTFAGTLSYSGQQFNQVVQYFVRAYDSSSQQNSADGLVQMFPIAASAQLDDFEGSLGPWIFTGEWGITTQSSFSGTHSIEDSPGTQYPPNSDTWAGWDQSWNLTDFTRAWLSFRERHLLEENSDWGKLEVSADNGPWETLFEITGAEDQWFLREIALDDYCAGSCDELRFRFRMITDETGSLFGWYIDDLAVTGEIIVPVEDDKIAHNLPDEYALGPIYPNPFNPLTNIGFALPEAADVSITIHNTRGQVVSVLADDHYSAGRHQVTFKGGRLASGIYLCRLTANDFEAVQKIVLIK